MTKTIDDFYKDLGIRESSGRYYVKNWANYLGMYQMVTINGNHVLIEK